MVRQLFGGVNRLRGYRTIGRNPPLNYVELPIGQQHADRPQHAIINYVINAPNF
ncbi:hypothetical protein NTG1052_140086 [Candidatus Nitrotoga sp. 1052]|nr:hypothetical protein NTG1052_140086 [Candidatus Nitrotoga sp. 1052]